MIAGEPPLEPQALVTDVRALKALAHPLRSRLLGLLRLHGPSTATLLGQRVGESSGTTSYHLRQLADWGFVADVGGLGTGRERWWRAVHRMTTWEPAEFPEGEGAEVADELERRLVEQRGRLLGAWLEQREELGPRWRRAADLSDWALRLTPEQTAELAAELAAVLRRWSQAHPAAATAEASELVSVFTDVFPLRDWPP